MILAGFHAVEESVRADPRRVEWVLFDAERRDARARELQRLCREGRVAVRFGPRGALDRLAPRHQGVVARVAAARYASHEELVSARPSGARLVLVLDGVEDPHNLGAILRVAEGAGASVAVPERGSAPLSDTVVRVSAGAAGRVPLHRAGNLRNFLETLKGEGFTVVGLDERGRDLFETDLSGDVALVLGSEGKGLRRLVRETCDFLARIPMAGALASLNVSTAAAVAAYEVVRRRHKILA